MQTRMDTLLTVQEEQAYHPVVVGAATFNMHIHLIRILVKSRFIDS